MSQLTDEENEADKMLVSLIADGYGFTIINNNFLIACKNEDFQPDNGSNPNIVCTFRQLIDAARRNYKTADWSTINDEE